MSVVGETGAAEPDPSPPVDRWPSAGKLSVQRSLFGEILDWMLAPLLVLWPMSVVLTWLVAQGLANKPFDRELSAMVRFLAQGVEVASASSPTAPSATAPGGLSEVSPAAVRFHLPAAAPALLGGDEVDAVYYQVLGPRDELLGGNGQLPVPHDDPRAPAGEIRYRDETFAGETVRVASMWLDTPGRGGRTAADATLAAEAPLIQVAQTVGKRSRFATEIIKGVILPQFVILPLAVLLVWLALARGIAPLNQLQQRIRQRASHDLSPIDERQAPEEVSPLVRAINDLLTRLDESMRTQKRFLADAAHQLKTPLAGLRTQAELAQRQIDAGQHDPQALKKTLQQIARSSQSAAHMVNQLLAMARAENREHAVQRQPVDLARLATETVQDFVPRALEKRIDLGYEGPGDALPGHSPSGASVLGHPVLLRELIRNLVDNALHYTPEGGSVTVRVIGDPFGQVVVLQVEDSGPGIAAADRELVFQPFYRSLGTGVEGSGLGLAIVRQIALQHRAEVVVSDALPRQPAPGTLIVVRIPAVGAEAEERERT